MLLRYLRLIGFLSMIGCLFLGSAQALEREQFEIIAISAPGGTSMDHREYYLVLEIPPSTGPQKVTLVPMTESVADTLSQLREGSNACTGKRFKAQIFEIFSCTARH